MAKRKIKKVYVATVLLEHMLTFYVDGRRLVAEFTGMNVQTTQPEYATFATYDETLQELIEESSAYGKEYKLKSEEVIEATTPKVPENTKITDNGGKGDDNEPIVLSEIDTADAAKKWLNENKGIAYGDMPNGAVIIQLCEKHNVSMPLIVEKFKDK